MKVDPRQLDLFAPLPSSSSALAATAPATKLKPAELPPLPIALANHGPWPGLSAWSWLHMFALHRHNDGRVYTIHPAFDGAPWLDGHAEALGYRPIYDECMAERRRQGEMRFASEFCGTTGWRDLLANRHLTRPQFIVEAVAQAMQHLSCEPRFRLDHDSAREIMVALGSTPPEYPSDDEMIDAVLSTRRVEFADLERVTWWRIYAWQLGIVRYRKRLAVSIYDEEQVAA